MSKAKILELEVNKEEYAKYCKENGLDPNHKLSRLRFIRTIDDLDDDVKETIDSVLNGELDINEIEEENEQCRNDADTAQGLEYIVKGLAYISGAKNMIDKVDVFKGLPEEDKVFIAEGFMLMFHKNIQRMLDCIFSGINFCKEKNKIKGDKNDKKA